MALYADTLSGTLHRPGSRLTDSSQYGPLSNVPSHTFYPTPTNLNSLLSPGLYWVAVKTSEAVGQDIQFLEYATTANANGTGNSFSTVYTSTGMPATFPPSVTPTGDTELSLFIRTKRYWH